VTTARRARTIVLTPIGSRGDVQPMVALGLELAGHGHHVTIAAPENFASWVREHGLAFAPVGPDIEAQIRHFGEQAHETRKQMVIMRREIIPHQFDALPDICARADLLVGAGLQVAGPSIAELLGIPYAFVAYAPVVLRSGRYPPPVVRSQRLPGIVNRAVWHGFEAMLGVMIARAISRHRASLDLPPVRDVARYMTSFPILLAADRALTGDVPDLAPNVHRTSALRLPDDGTLPYDVQAYLDAGPAPVLVGFGSMVTDRAADLVATFVRAAEAAGVRLIVQAGWTGITPEQVAVPATCLLTGAIAHSALLPRVGAVVHHGGSGTTASVARAGCPQLVIPHLLDQFYWAERVRTLGLGPEPIHVRRVRRSEPLATALHDLATNAEYRANAQALAPRLTDDGAADCATILEGFIRAA
jgi:UDP:flavonoid glycosyltransferase YjiC (YdhE family)